MCSFTWKLKLVSNNLWVIVGFEYIFDCVISWNDKNDTQCKNNDIIMLNNRIAEELSLVWQDLLDNI